MKQGCAVLTSLGVVFGCLLCGRPAAAGDGAIIRFDEPPFMWLIAIHGPHRDAVHPLEGGVAWPTTGAIAESTELIAQFIDIICMADHVVTPHGEPPNPGAMFDWAIDGSDYDNGGHSLPREPGPVLRHQQHWDHYGATWDFWTSSLGPQVYIDKFIYTYGAVHSNRAPKRRIGRNERERNRSQTGRLGACQIMFDDTTGSFELLLVVEGVQPGDILDARIHAGIPNAEGPAILSLGGGGLWTDVHGWGAARIVSGGSFPMAYLPDLLSGTTYVQVDTLSQPTGEVRLQLVGAQSVTLPTDYVVTRGKQVGGALGSLLDNDDDRLVLQEGPPFTVTDPSAQVEVGTTLPMHAPLYLDLRAQTACSALPSQRVLQRIELFNYWQGRWEVVHEETATTYDRSTEIEISVNVGRFVEPFTLRCRARIGWYDLSAFTPGWTASVDSVSWVSAR